MFGFSSLECGGETRSIFAKKKKAAVPQNQTAGNWLQAVALMVESGEQHPWDEDTYPILWGFTRHLREKKSGASYWEVMSIWSFLSFLLTTTNTVTQYNILLTWHEENKEPKKKQHSQPQTCRAHWKVVVGLLENKRWEWMKEEKGSLFEWLVNRGVGV